MSATTVTKEDIINWLQEHETAWEDFCSRFHIEQKENEDVDVTQIKKIDILSWIFEHEQLTEDMCRYFETAIIEGETS